MKEPLDVVIQPEFRKVLDDFCDLFNIRIAFYSAEGCELFSGQGRPGCEFCYLLREPLGAEPACRECDDRYRKRARRLGRMVAYRCHAGMTEAVIPVSAGESLLGYVMIGQIRTAYALPAKWARLAVGHRVHGKLQTAFRRQPCIPPGRVKKILHVFAMLVEYVSQRQLVQLRQPTDLQKVLEHLQQNLHRNVPLAEAARLVHRSPVTLTHRCRKVLGKSYKTLQTEMKLDQAERWLAETPAPAVQEVAGRLGYNDPLYFSRLFAKYKGSPPSRVRSAANK